MKVVILAGGFGTRISEESVYKPKPLIEVGGMPIIWHIMKYYSKYGFNDFIVCAGYKQNCLKEYFSNYYLNNADVTFDMKNNNILVHNSNSEQWNVTVVDTGLNTMTGGRIKRIQKYIGDESFMLTYGDGVSDIDINKLIQYHRDSKTIATLTAVMPGGRFGALNIDDEGIINSFVEKKREDGGWINGGFMVLEPKIFDYLVDDSTIFEREPLERLSSERQLSAFKHNGFWQCMDSMKDHKYLEELIATGRAPWILW